MPVSSSETLCLGVGVKESPSFSISISYLVKNMLDTFISFGDIFCVVIDNDVNSFLSVLWSLSNQF